MNIIIGGDLVPTESNINMFTKGNIKENLDSKFIKEWYECDYRILNLECPICDSNKKILKFGPSLSANSKTINGIKELEPDLLLLSNNHIMDYDVEGLNQTIEILKKNKIDHIGIINNKYKKNETFFFDKNGVKVGIYNICDSEFSIATERKKGTASLNILKNYIEIKEAKEKCDYLIVIYHGGKEYYRYPSPNLRDICRYFVEIGADIVVCQHSHCIGSNEKYKKGTIIYGIGNFIFDESDNEFEKNALLLKINFTKNSYDIKYIPIEKNNSLIKLSSDASILTSFENRSKKIIDDNFILSEYKRFSKSLLNNYFSVFFSKNIITKFINKFIIKNYYVKKFKKEELVKILNVIECEAHREVLITALKEYIGDNNYENNN